MDQSPTIDRLLNLVPDAPQDVLTLLRSHPQLASQQDAHGYSLVHAAASYGHVDLLTALIREHSVDPDLVDEDGESALFSVEEERMAQALLDLGADINLTNTDGQTAAQKLADEDEQPAIAAFLNNVAGDSQPLPRDSENEDSHSGPPPPLPNGIQLNVGTMHADEAGDAPDPEFRRRIEMLAARPDFQTEAGQSELRNLVADALSGMTAGESERPPTTRRRVE